VHLTVANLNDKFHRASEAPTTEALLQAIFPDEQRFAIHARCPGIAVWRRRGGEP
jgi:succinylarginine dihydrolase